MDPIYSGPKMEARQGAGGATAPRLDPNLVKDPFFYGYRWVRVTEAGRTFSKQVPLTRGDLLDPQEDDKVSNRSWHDLITARIGEILRTLFAFRGLDDVLVMGNVKMLWANPKISRVAPDLAVSFGVTNPYGRDFTSFREADEGTRPAFALEVVSEATADTDKNDKPGVYQKAKVQEYFMLDQRQEKWTLNGRRLNPSTGRYRTITPDSEGCLVAETMEVAFKLGDDAKSLVLTDLRTGEILLDHLGKAEALQAESEARKAAEQRVADQEAKIQELMARLEQLEAKND